MNAGLVQAIFYGLTRLAASAGGVYLLTQHEYVTGAALVAGAAGFTVFDKFKVDGKIQDALAASPSQGT